MSAHLNFLGHELVHFLITTLVAIFLFWRYRNWCLIFVSFAFGIFIDLDHWFDYFAYYGLNINLANFFDIASYVVPAGKIYVPLHGWEFVVPFWFVGKWTGKKFKVKGLEWAVSFSYLSHLLWDQFSFSHHPLAYFFIYRLINNFSLASFNVF